MQLFSNTVNRVRDMNSHKMMMMLAMKIMIKMMMMIAMKIIIAMMIMITGMTDTCIITMIYRVYQTAVTVASAM